MANQNRQPAGAPARAGGQFASGSHDEAGALSQDAPAPQNVHITAQSLRPGDRLETIRYDDEEGEVTEMKTVAERKVFHDLDTHRVTVEVRYDDDTQQTFHAGTELVVERDTDQDAPPSRPVRELQADLKAVRRIARSPEVLTDEHLQSAVDAVRNPSADAHTYSMGRMLAEDIRTKGHADTADQMLDEINQKEGRS